MGHVTLSSPGLESRYIYILICAPRLYFPTREGVSILSRTFGNLRLLLQFGLFLGIRKILIQESGDRQRYTNIQHPCQSDRVRLVVAECGLLFFFFFFSAPESERKPLSTVIYQVFVYRFEPGSFLPPWSGQSVAVIKVWFTPRR